MFAEIVAAVETTAKTLELADCKGIQEVVFQGDCLDIVKHFAGASRIHRADLVRKLDSLWQLLAQSPVKVHWSYVPRIGNKVADHLAGLAADSVRSDSGREEEVFFNGNEGRPELLVNTIRYPPVRIHTQDWRNQALQDLADTNETLSLEAPTAWRRELLVKYCIYHKNVAPPELETSWPGLVMYRRASKLPQGRHYALRHWQTSNKQVRYLALGPNAFDVDMKGCASTRLQPLPSLHEAREIFRTTLAHAPKAQTVLTKHLLQRAVGMDRESFLRFRRKHCRLRHCPRAKEVARSIGPGQANFDGTYSPWSLLL